MTAHYVYYAFRVCDTKVTWWLLVQLSNINDRNECLMYWLAETPIWCPNVLIPVTLWNRLWNPPTRRLVCAANSLLCSVHLSFSPARPLMRLDAVCILCLQRSASSSRVWRKGRPDEWVDVCVSVSQTYCLVRPFKCLFITPSNSHSITYFFYTPVHISTTLKYCYVDE